MLKDIFTASKLQIKCHKKICSKKSICEMITVFKLLRSFFNNDTHSNSYKLDTVINIHITSIHKNG